MRIALALVALVAVATSASAAPTILGVEVGAPLTLPECEFTTVSLPKADCWSRDAYDPRPNPSIDLFLTAETESRAGFIRQAIIDMDGNNVAALTILTTGVDSQQDVMRALRVKFGVPTRYRVDHLQNRMGARFAGIRAVWIRPGLIVRFDSTFDDLDNGEIDIMTPEYAKERAAQDKPPSL